MPRSYRFSSLASVLAAAVIALLPHAPRQDSDRGFDAPEAAVRYYEGRRVPIGSAISTAALYERAHRQFDTLPRFASRIGRTLPPAYRSMAVLDTWTSLGPGNIGGRSRIIRYHPVHHHVIFAAGVSGGIWKSDDNGVTWRPIASGLANYAINSLAIDPRMPDTIYAGTGEGYFREEIRRTGLPLRGGGIFVSRDGGQSWSLLPATTSADFHWVNDLELGIGDSAYVYAATRTGVWRSANRGESWTRLLSTAVRGGCLELALRPDHNDDTLFASCGSYDQATVYRISRSSRDAHVEAVLSEPGMGRTSLAVSLSHPEYVYALAASNDDGPNGSFRQGLLAVYRSTRGGAAGTWETRVTHHDPVKLNTLLLTNVSSATVADCVTNPNARNTTINMGWYVNVLAVDPLDPERVWAGGVDWMRSDDGGRNWGIVTSMAIQGSASQTAVHVDQHGIAFHPAYDGTANQTVIVSNDGGLFRTTTARAPATTGPRAPCSPVSLQLRWESLNRGYGVTQFYHGAAYADGTRYLGGTQDNGTVLGSDDAGNDGWRPSLGGDGGHVAVDPENPQILYAESQWANLARSINGGAQWQSRITGLDPVRSDVLGPDANYLFVTPFVMDPADRTRLWIGGEYIYRTSNSAESWTKASVALPSGGIMSAIAVSPRDPNVVIAGSHVGDVLLTRTALTATAQTAWSATRPRDGWVTSLAFDPRDTQVVYATYGNFGGSHVYRSNDGGSSWRSVDGAGDGRLPDVPVHSLVVDPDDSARLYVGTDIGVMVSVDSGQSWLIEETGYGPVVTEWLTLIRDSSGRKRLFAFTHGRGVWRVDIR
jgi:hypothetical protein